MKLKPLWKREAEKEPYTKTGTVKDVKKAVTAGVITIVPKSGDLYISKASPSFPWPSKS